MITERSVTSPKSHRPRSLGHPPGFLQACTQLELKVFLPLAQRITELDDWLQRVFAIEALVPGTTAPPLSQSDAYVVGSRLIALAMRLSLLAKLPVFEHGRVLGLLSHHSDTSQATIAIQIPCAGRPLHGTTGWVHAQTSLLLFNWFHGKFRSLGTDEVCRYVDESIVQPASKSVAAGKSTLPLLQAAWESRMPIVAQSGGLYQIGWGAKSRLLLNSGVDTDSFIGARTAQDKRSTANRLHLAGLPGPKHYAVASPDQAKQAAMKIGWPVVVKPVNRDRGEGVCVGIRNLPDLLSAFETAKALSTEVLIERMVAGHCHRLLVVRGKLVYCVQRLPKSVVGNGLATVSRLVAHKNQIEAKKAFWNRLKPFPVDDLAYEQLSKEGLDWESVPAQGQRVLLRPTQTEEWGGDIVDLTEQVHPQNVELALRCARLFGLEVAGIDLISTDITVPWYENGAIINEVNAAPAIGTSAAARLRTRVVVEQLLPDGGRIPVHVVVGRRKAWVHAAAIQANAELAGRRCFITDHTHTNNPNGHVHMLIADSLLDRCNCLLMSKEVDELVLVVSTDEVLHYGCPVDSIDSFVVHDDALVCHRNAQRPLMPEEVRRVVQTFTARVCPTSTPAIHAAG